MKTKIFLIAALVLTLNAATHAQTLPAYLPTDGLVGWWPFNGNANDESGNGNNGTVNGATLTEDRFGNSNAAYSFDGIDNFIDCGNISTLNNSSYISISVWFKCQSLLQEGAIIGAEFIQNSNYGWALTTDNFFTGGNALKAKMRNSNNPNGSAQLGYSQQILQTNNYYHAIFIFDGTESTNSQKLKVFLNEIPINLTYVDSLPTALPSTNFNTIVGGLNGSATNAAFDGIIDDIAIYNRALTQEEITALYTGEPINPPTACNPLPANLQEGLVGYWPFCGNANDESGNGNDGAVNGATLTEDRFGDANSAYDFDGVDDFINVINSPDLNLSGEEFTLSVWYTISAAPAADNRNLLCKSSGAGPFNKWVVMKSEGEGFYPEGEGLITYPSLNSSSFNGFIYSSNPVSINNWSQLLIVKENSSLKIYSNGVLQNTTGTITNVLPNSADLRIGGDEFNSGDNNKLWSGKLDDIGIWNRALSADEVQQLYTLNACTFTVYDTVTVTQTVYDTITTYTSVTDTLIINTLITELAPPANSNSIKVFPNPANSHITIDYGNFSLMNGYQLRIENSLGQQVFQTNITQQSDYLSLASWGGNGLYFVHIIDPQSNTIDIRKIVLQ
jgi:hypothetical protein